MATSDPKVWMSFVEESGLLEENDRMVLTRPTVNKLVKDVDTLMERYKSALPQTDGKENKRMTRLLSTSEKLVKELTQTMNKSNCMTSLYELIRKPKLDKKFNSNINLLHCAGGWVLDTESGEAVPRRAEPIDYSTRSTHVVFKP